MDADEEEGFSFIWTIQNYNFCFRKNKDNFYVTPTFELYDESGEKWCLNLYPERYFSHDSLGLAFQKCTGSNVTSANNFGSATKSSRTNMFGKSSFFPSQGQPQKAFGNPTTAQAFGSSSTSQAFGSSATSQAFGSSSTSQAFGSSATSQAAGSSVTTQNVDRMLPQSHPKRRTDEIMLEISIRDVKGSYEKKFSGKLLFGSYPDKSDVSKLTINKDELKAYLDNDSITIKCRVWDSTNTIFTKRQCYARTIIDLEKITYAAAVEGFQDLENGVDFSKIYSIFSHTFPFKMIIFSSRETYAENKLQVTIYLKDPRKIYSVSEISLIGANGIISHSTRHEYNFDSSSLGQVWTFPIIEVGTILDNKEIFLSNGGLSLLCEFGFSSGVAYNKIERIDYARRNSYQLQGCNPETDSLESLKDSFQRLYDKGKFSDLTIKTPTREYRVHKSILCARSEYFTDIIENDPNVLQTGVLNITGVGNECISKMLLFFYTGTVGEDMKFRTAINLYHTAHNYKIAALKKICSDFLKDNFTVTDICEILGLADFHQDLELKSAAQSFIFKHNVMDSDEWKKFMKEKVNLASEVMHTMLKNSKVPSLFL